MKVKINIYVDEEIKQMLKEYADKNYTSISGAITKLIIDKKTSERKEVD